MTSITFHGAAREVTEGAQQVLATRLRKELGYPVHIPNRGEVVEF